MQMAMWWSRVRSWVQQRVAWLPILAQCLGMYFCVCLCVCVMRTGAVLHARACNRPTIHKRIRCQCHVLLRLDVKSPHVCEGAVHQTGANKTFLKGDKVQKDFVINGRVEQDFYAGHWGSFLMSNQWSVLIVLKEICAKHGGKLGFEKKKNYWHNVKKQQVYVLFTDVSLIASAGQLSYQ